MGEAEQYVGDVVVQSGVDGRQSVAARSFERLGILASLLQGGNSQEPVNPTGFDMGRGKGRVGDEGSVAGLQGCGPGWFEIPSRCPCPVSQFVDP